MLNNQDLLNNACLCSPCLTVYYIYCC